MKTEEENLQEEETSDVEENDDNNLDEEPELNYGQKAINNLKLIAKGTLIFGIIGALIIWVAIGEIQDPEYHSSSFTKSNPSGIILGFVLLFSSIITSSLLHVVCGIAENIIAIRINSEIAMSSTDEES